MKRGSSEVFVKNTQPEEVTAAIAAAHGSSSEDDAPVVDPLESSTYNVILSELSRGTIKPSEAFDDIIDTRSNE